MIDLSREIEKPYEIKMFDGTILQIKKPSQEMLLEIVKLQNTDNIELALNAMSDILLKILNRNMNDRKYTKKDMNDFSVDIMSAVIQDYLANSLNQLGK